MNNFAQEASREVMKQEIEKFLEGFLNSKNVIHVNKDLNIVCWKGYVSANEENKI